MVETIQLADLGRKSIEVVVDTLVPFTNGIKSLRINAQIVENCLSISKNGVLLHDSSFCIVPGKSWISFIDSLYVTDTLVITYEKSLTPDMVITNWDPGKGNYIFYNKNNYLNTNNIHIRPKVFVYPNPANERVKIDFEGKDISSITIIVTDIAGRTILKQKTDSDYFEFTTESYTSGIFFLSVFQGGNLICSEKLILIK